MYVCMHICMYINKKYSSLFCFAVFFGAYVMKTKRGRGWFPNVLLCHIVHSTLDVYSTCMRYIYRVRARFLVCI